VKLSDKSLPFFLLLPSIIIIVSLVIYPTAFAYYVSLTKYDLTNPEQGMIFVGPENYIRIIQDTRFQNALIRSITFSSLSVILSFVMGLVTALVVNQEIKGGGFFKTIFLVPWVLAPVLIGYGFKLNLNYNIGVVNDILELLGIGRIAFFGYPDLSLITIILIDVWQWFPFMMLVILAGLEALPREPFEAAQIDGASAIQRFRYITFPLIRPIVLIVILIRVMDAFKEYDKIMVTTAGGPGYATETLSLLIAKVGFQQFNIGYASAMAIVTIIFIIFVSWVYMKAAGGILRGGR